MKMVSFKKKVNKHQKMLQTVQTAANKWECANKSNMIKILYKVSVFSHFDFNFQSLDTLLDFAVSVHVFNTKKRFSNFNKIIMCQNLLYNSNIIFIEGWSQISLFFKVKNCIKLLTLNHVVYISNFPLNFVFFDCLQKRDFN